MPHSKCVSLRKDGRIKGKIVEVESKMSKKESHPIRNGIIATVVGGLILTFVPQFRSVAIKVLDWAWSGLTWVWSSFLSTYSISGWVLLLIGALACTGLIAIYYLLQEYFNPEHKKYTEDFFHGAKWRWSWVGARISNLWCFCPDCDSELVYDDSSCNQFSRLSSLETPHTKFICEHCNRRVVSTVKGGNKFYVKGAVERAIRRKLRKEK